MVKKIGMKIIVVPYGTSPNGHGKFQLGTGNDIEVGCASSNKQQTFILHLLCTMPSFSGIKIPKHEFEQNS